MLIIYLNVKCNCYKVMNFQSQQRERDSDYDNFFLSEREKQGRRKYIEVFLLKHYRIILSLSLLKSVITEYSRTVSVEIPKRFFLWT